MGSRAGTLKVAAKKCGLSVIEYEALRAAGEKWCYRCRSWHPVGAFALDASRGDGRSASCRESISAAVRARYKPKPRPKAGRRFKQARNGDKRQARGRVNHLVNVGLLPDPDDVPCTDCGDVDSRHSYDHFKGYEAEHHEDVEAVCYPCHARRAVERGETKRRTRGERGRYAAREVTEEHGRAHQDQLG